MESYVEVSFLYAFVTVILSIRIAAYWCVKIIRINWVFAYAALIAGCGCLFFPYAWLLMCLMEALFFLTVFRYQKKVYLLGFAFRCICFFSAFAWYGGSFHNGIYYVPLHTLMTPIWLCYGLLWEMLKYKWKQLLARGEYVYRTKLKVKNAEIALKGYLDSGNLLCHKGIPVVFLDQKYSSYFDKKSIELVVMNTIKDNSLIPCYPCLLSIDGSRSCKVYVSCEKALMLPFDCEVLLNMNAMTLG